MVKRGSGRRDLVKGRNSKFYAARDARGRFRSMDNVGRSLAADRRQRAKREVKSGQGDKGDRRR